MDFIWETKTSRVAEKSVVVSVSQELPRELDKVDIHQRPRVIFESWEEQATMWKHGPISAHLSAVWKDLGYSTRNKIVSSLQVGGAIRQQRLLVVRHLDIAGLPWEWGKEESLDLVHFVPASM